MRSLSVIKILPPLSLFANITKVTKTLYGKTAKHTCYGDRWIICQGVERNAKTLSSTALLSLTHSFTDRHLHTLYINKVCKWAEMQI